MVAHEATENLLDFEAAEDAGDQRWPLGPFDVFDMRQIEMQHAPIQKEQGAECDVLGRGSHMAVGGKVIEGDLIRISLDCRGLEGTVDLVGSNGEKFSAARGQEVLASRASRPDLCPNARLPDDTRLWAALQGVSGGAWGGCVYDPDAITAKLLA